MFCLKKGMNPGCRCHHYHHHHYHHYYLPFNTQEKCLILRKVFPGFFSMTLTSKEEVTEETKMLKKQ